jgi:ABC-type multidrug transport system ATPase subunit
MIKVQNLTKRFGKLTAVDQMSFDIEVGESVALWGENGAGKTTALRCLLGVMPYEGLVTLDDYNTKKQSKKARHLMGFVPQEMNFHDDMAVHETIYFYARLKKTTTKSDYVAALLERLGLISYIQRRVGELSGGMKQRLALVIALLSDPPVLILDEPTANLDVKTRDDFLALLIELNQSGKTLLFSSHRLEEVLTLASRVLVLDSGRLVADCPPAELSKHLGNQARLKLHFDGEKWIVPAVEALIGHGFSAERNGTGVWVQVLPLEKAKPISLLAEAGIPVRDFQIE